MDVWFSQTIEDVLCLSHIYIIALNKLLQEISDFVDQKCNNIKPSHLLTGSLLAFYSTLVMTRCLVALKNAISLEKFLLFARNLPIVKGLVMKKLDKLGTDIKRDLMEVYHGEEFISSLPKKPLSAEVLLKKVKHYQLFDTCSWQQGRLSGAIYTNNSARFNQILLSVFGSNMWTNPLHSDVFAGVRKMESEIIRMVVSMFNGDPDKVLGNMTSGGTESIMMACKAYRDYAKKARGIKGQAEIVVPVTAHAAFEKSAKFLDCKIIFVPVNKRTFKVDLAAMRRVINENTCMLVGSAPQFPHGVIDPIEEIGQIGLSHEIPVHVDACLGGFLIPFIELAGLDLDERFDFRVPGVTSISADTHKYGYAPKGTSVIMYNDKKYIHHQYSIQTDWPGGLYASPTLPGSRPGALVATCWAAMMYHGLEGYVEATGKIIRTTRWIKKELSSVEGLKVLGNPLVSVIAFASDSFDIYAMNGRLKELGWNLNSLQYPSAFHLCVTLMHTNNSFHTSFVRDVRAVAKQLMLEPKTRATGSAAIYGMAQTIPDRSLVSEICVKYLDACLGH